MRMKKLYKTMLLAIPALAVALAVGVTTMGCGDTSTGSDMTTTVVDMAMPTTAVDMAKKD
jgi:hypothetical protein